MKLHARCWLAERLLSFINIPNTNRQLHHRIHKNRNLTSRTPLSQLTQCWQQSWKKSINFWAIAQIRRYYVSVKGLKFNLVSSKAEYVCQNGIQENFQPELRSFNVIFSSPECNKIIIFYILRRHMEYPEATECNWSVSYFVIESEKSKIKYEENCAFLSYFLGD